MFAKYFFVGLLCLIPLSTSISQKKRLVFWNVGQGSWTTYMNDRSCLHIDSGGTRLPRARDCQNKPNLLFFTHYDWDHIGFAQRLQRELGSLCRWDMIPARTPLKKRLFLEKIPRCDKKQYPGIQQIYESKFLKKNESHAYLIEGEFLITGDSDQKIETQFSHLQELKQVRLILAGHHGSRTSLSPSLLKNMTSLEMIMASCLKRRYGHPHQETKIKAQNFNKALITTELYGSVAFELAD